MVAVKKLLVFFVQNSSKPLDYFTEVNDDGIRDIRLVLSSVHNAILGLSIQFYRSFLQIC